MLVYFLLALLLLPFSQAYAVDQQQDNKQIIAVHIYTDAQLLELIRDNQYLQQVTADRCQLVNDIRANAEVLTEPLYQFLWGEMLNHGVCVKANPTRGMKQLMQSAEQGSPEALVKLAQYYRDGKYVIKDKSRAVHYALPAAAGGDLPAQLILVELLGQGFGSPLDYELAYHWLYNQVFADSATKKKAHKLLQVLATKMPDSAVARAQKVYLRSY